MSGRIFKACSRFLYSVVFLGFAACFAPANASVCFLPDADNCGQSSSNIPIICDGVRTFSKDKCDEAADLYSNKNAHYFCKTDENSDCSILDYTPCVETDPKYEDCPSCKYASPIEGKACKAFTQKYTQTVCSDKGIASEKTGSRTMYNCVPISTEVKGCEDYTLTAPLTPAENYECSECTPDVYKTDYDGNLNKTGKGNTVYKCEKKDTCTAKGYKTCASCDSNQICVLNGEKGSDGPCAKGCQYPNAAVCDSNGSSSVSDEYADLKKVIDGLAVNNEAFSRLGSSSDFDLYETMKKANLLQSDWTSKEVRGRTYIDDQKGNLLNVFMRDDDNNDGTPRVHMDIYLDKTYDTIFTHQVMPISKCENVYKNLMKPLYCRVHRVGVYSTNFTDWTMDASFGDGFCGDGDKVCLKYITDSAINKACNSCQSDNKQCYMPIIFGKGEVYSTCPNGYSDSTLICLDGYTKSASSQYPNCYKCKPTITVALSFDTTTGVTNLKYNKNEYVTFNSLSSDNNTYDVKLVFEGDYNARTVVENQRFLYKEHSHTATNCNINGGGTCDQEQGATNEYSRYAYNVSVLVNDETVLDKKVSTVPNNLDLTSFVGRTYSDGEDYIIKFVQANCSNQGDCAYGSYTEDNGYGGKCTRCYPACNIGYYYGEDAATQNCDVRPITGYLKQISNPNCLKCQCKGSKLNPATGKYEVCAFI